MLGGKNAKPLGYTIIEVMIFLAVSGVMFLIAATFISGKQAEVEFRNNANDLSSNTSSMIDDVENGFYPSGGNVICTVTGGTVTAAPGPSSDSQGTNEPCIFLGKALIKNATGYTISSIAGARLTTGSDPADVSSLADAHPAVISGSNLSYGLGGATITAVCALVGSATPSPTTGFAVLSDLSQGGNSGAMSLQLYTLGVSGLPSSLNSSELAKEVDVYLNDGSHNAEVIIDGNDGSGVVSNTVNLGIAPPGAPC